MIMKKIFLIGAAVLAVLLSATFITYAIMPKDDDHVLKEQWKKFESARNSDLPKKELQILNEIKAEAIRQRLPWDCYDAAVKARDVVASMNWKLRDSMNVEIDKAVEAYNEPVLTFFHMRNGSASASLNFVKANEAALRKSCTPILHDHSAMWAPDNLEPVVRSFLGNDYLYALWSIYLGSSDRESRDLLGKEYGDAYPMAALLDYIDISRFTALDSVRKGKYAEYGKAHQGQAVALLARQKLIGYKFSDLDNRKGTTAAEFSALRAECVEFVKLQKSFSGQEKKIADCCTFPAGLIERMDEKQADFNLDKSVLTATVRNVHKVSVSLKLNGKEKFSAVMKNDENSYYRQDTLKLSIPETLDDGEYELICDYGEKCEMTYNRHSISLATQDIQGKTYVYAADWQTGKPVEKADIIVYRKDDRLMSHDGVRLNGFTVLPEDVLKALEGKSTDFALSYKDAQGRLRLSHKSGAATDWNRYLDDSRESHSIAVFTDCGAYRPGETLKFKAICYSGNAANGYKVQAGKKLTVRLDDAEGKQVGKQTLTSNEYGSVSGEFALPVGRRGGRWNLCVTGNSTGENEYVTVDEYVLPNFDLSFDRFQGLLFPGDEVTVSGVVKSYSGHSLAGAKIYWNADDKSGDLEIGAGGKFSFKFRPDAKDRHYVWTTVALTVVDATGETRDYSKTYSLVENFYNGPELLNEIEGSYRNAIGMNTYGLGIVGGNAVLKFPVKNTDGQPVDVKVSYRLLKDGKAVDSGSARSNAETVLDLSKWKIGYFTLESECVVKDQQGKEYKDESESTFLKVASDAQVLDEPVRDFVRRMDSDGISLQLGDAMQPIWASIQLWGLNGQLLRSEMVSVNGRQGQKGSLKTIDWEFKTEYPDEVVMYVFYFRDGSSFRKEMTYSRPVSKYRLPLSISSFTDEARPGRQYELSFLTAPSAESAVTIFDKSTETIQPNRWYPINLATSSPYVPYVNTWLGDDYARSYYHTKGFFAGAVAKVMNSRADMVESYDYCVEEESVVMTESAMMDGDMVARQTVADDEVPVRSDFKAALAFEPHVVSDADGNSVVKFTTSDKLSTYIVQIFSHDKSMHNDALRREMLVTMPVKLSVVEPLYLFKGDRYRLNATVSSMAKKSVGGSVKMQLYRGGDWEKVKSTQPLKTVTLNPGTLPAGGNLSFGVDIDVDEFLSLAGAKEKGLNPLLETMGVKLTFSAGEDSDAIYFNIPVYGSAQTLTESHSAVLLAGADRSKLLAELRGSFVNVQAEGAECKEISIVDMVREALPELQNPECENLLSLLDAYYANALSASLGGATKDDSVQAGLMKKILDLRNPDGGFAWFKEMDSSPLMTAMLLQRLGGLRDRGLIDLSSLASVCADACAYLDKVQFDTKGKRPFWCGGLADEQYLLTRSMYPEVKLAAKPDRKTRKEFANYLTPKKNRGLQGQVFPKARRLLILVNLCSSESGKSLASGLGVKLAADKKLNASLKADYASLFEYAQPHKGYGRYFPNAVMPFRGLLESEAYAHSLICDLFSAPSRRNLACVEASAAAEYARLADDLRLWLMLQKETQKWESDPGFVEALASILDASQAVLDTRVIVLSKTYRKPFEEIKAAGNGFTVARKYAVMDREGNTTALADGDVLHVGDRVVATYSIWNEENRSFVRLNATRPACLRPVDQLSGRYGWWLRPICVDGWYTFSPQGYRWVREDHTEYWFDSYPEEKSSVTEVFFVTQEGTFTSPVTEIESLYAPHYRANDAYSKPLTTVK